MFKFIKQCFDISGKYKKNLVMGTIFILLQNFSMLLSFMGVYYGFSNLNNLTPSVIWTSFAIVSFAFFFYFLTNWLQNVMIGGVFFGIYKDIRLKIGEQLKIAPMGYFSETRLSKILAGLTNVLRALENYSPLAFNFSLSGISLCFFLLAGMFSMSWKVGLMVVAFLILSWICVYILFQISNKEIFVEHEAVSSFVDALIDGIRGTQVLRSFPEAKGDTVKKVHSQVQETSENIMNALIRFEIIFVIASRFYHAILNIASVSCVLYTAYLAQLGELSLAQALTMCVAGFMLFQGLIQLENSAILSVKNPAHLSYMQKLLNIPQIKNGPITKASISSDLAFDHVDFSYIEGEKVLQDLSCQIKSGSKTAIVGPSGSGKTTMINLMARFYDPDKGSITLGEHNLKDYHIDTLLGHFSLVFQDVYLFNDNVRNNIRFAKPDASEEEIIEVAKKARCHDFIMALPDGYDTLVGEGGARFSGGEKQRISIARALLKDAPVILLDEATSSIDPENEYEIMSAIKVLTQNKTVISIAHRLSTVREADQILVIDQGRVVQHGKHEDLMNREGIYKRFIQAREQAENWVLSTDSQ